MFLLTTWDKQCDLNYSNHLKYLEHIVKECVCTNPTLVLKVVSVVEERVQLAATKPQISFSQIFPKTSW